MMDKKKQGKKNRASGQRFELRVRKDLESKGWIVDKWSNNVEEVCYANKDGEMEITENCSLNDAINSRPKFPIRKLIPAKRKFNPFKKVLGIGTGFPDFIVYKLAHFHEVWVCGIHGVEVKSNGYLDKIEKEKCRWLLKNHVFSKIWIASKGEKRGTIKYAEFEDKG